MDDANRPVWMRRLALQKRWGDMPTSTFYNRLQRRLIPAPEYPFGPNTPYWRLDAIEAHEKRAEATGGEKAAA
jgi:hypothetical protein